MAANLTTPASLAVRSASPLAASTLSAALAESRSATPALREALLEIAARDRTGEVITAVHHIPARTAQYASLPGWVRPELAAAYRAKGVEQLYTHQAAAAERVRAGRNVVVVTPTASGKTLCYNLPVLNAVLENPDTRALYLFPTKALAQDQFAELYDLAQRLDQAFGVYTYDGDTPADARRAIRERGHIVLTNPDMLHTGILPHHTRWTRLFENLRYIVLDELHTYRGVFGSHLGNVLRRLKRIARFYGSDPQFVCSSATIANPGELASRLIEREVDVLDSSGAPAAEKFFVFYNPPVVNRNLGIRRSYVNETSRVAQMFLDRDLQTIVFANSRLYTEVMLTYLQQANPPQPGGRDTVFGYRGGYLPGERRAIERGLRSGDIRGVVATNALELGVDIGQMSAAVIAGYPGTIASVWQQAGRAGRRSETSAAVFVASGAPLDQYIAAHPRYLFESSPEHGLINPDNLAILVRHLRCAAFELPFEAGEAFGGFDDVTELLEVLREDGELHRSNGTYRWVAGTYPADGMSLRTSGDETVVIQDVTNGRPLVIGEVDALSAPVYVHEGAVYLHEGRQFIVESLDWEQKVASVRSADLDYYTRASEAAEVEVIETFEVDGQPSPPTLDPAPLSRANGSGEGGGVAQQGPERGVRAHRAHGRVRVTSQPTSYRKVKRYTHETLGYGPIDLPPREMETTAYWLWIDQAVVEQLQAGGVLLSPNDYGPNWPEMRNLARARDGYRCQQCGAAELPSPETGEGQGGGRQHDVHHIRPFREFGYLPGVNDNYLQANALDNLLTLCRACHHRAETARGTRTALGGLAHALGNLAPLYLMCDPRDVGLLSELRGADTKLPTITIYDHVPEGIGFSERLYELHDDLLRGALELVTTCACRDGCPACIGPAGEGADIKDKTRLVLQAIAKPPSP